MADSGDLISFDAIETQKENIQSLPGGRSAKQLALLCSPLAAAKSPPLSQTQDLKNRIRQDFEKELGSIDEADDPLDIYDRYIKWTMQAYPSAQATNESNLLPLLERATKTFLSSAMYKNDPRYLKLWLLYVKLFADSPRETYAFLAKHGVGEGLALYYEEFGAWLERNDRWAQAEEVFAIGVDKDARPRERLLRKYAEFQHRRDAKQGGDDGPQSPVLPTVRPALAAKSDPFASDNDPQARDRAEAAAAAARASKPSRAKMAVFADGEEPARTSSSGSAGWESLGSLAERKKENTHEPKAWAGETLDGGRKLNGGPKMAVFRDPSLSKLNENVHKNTRASRKVTVNPRTGKAECVFVDVESVYPNGMDNGSEEFSFEELRARRRGLLNKDWGHNKAPNKVTDNHDTTCHLNLPTREAPQQESSSGQISNLPQTVPLKDEPNLSKKLKKDDRANRTRKIRVMEVRAETQTVQINLDSPSGPKIRKKKQAEATMTIHTKEAMDDVYEMFNQPLEASEPTIDEVTEEVEEEDDDDDFTSVGESTGTGRISASASEFGDDVTGDYTMSSKTDADTSTHQTLDGSEFSDFTGTSGIDGTDEADDPENDDEDLSVVVLDTDRPSSSGTAENTSKSITQDYEEITPVDEDLPELDYFEPVNNGNMMPYRATKAPRLPFMTPIVEKTESSIGAMTSIAERKGFNPKTPSRENHKGSFPDLDLDDTGPMSSPFQDNLADERENIKIAQPALPKPNRSTQPLAESATAVPPKPKDLPTERPKGPIILDTQCNPMNENIRSTIISQIRPSLDTYTGFYGLKDTVSGKSAEIRKFVKASGKGDVKPPVLEFAHSKRKFTVKKELGRGAFAPVYLADSELRDEALENFASNRRPQEVIKMEDPPSSWEFYIIRQAKRRLGVLRPSESIVDALEMHLFADEGFLIEEYRNQGTLLDAINLSRAENGGAMDELLAMFFAVEIFRTVEALHSKSIIHGDLKADNVLIRLDDCLSASHNDAGSWRSQYARDGSGGWAEKGIMLIDFGRGVDMRVFKPEVQFIADWKTTEADCAEMREMRPWTYQVDYHGLAGIVHSLLFGKYMEVRAEGGGALSGGSTKRYAIREGLKRYWRTDIWAKVFDMLLNPLLNLDKEDGKKLPMLFGLKDLREEMEKHLEANCEKGSGLKAMLRRLESSMRERRK